jgi:hypothetical protein
MKMTMNTITPSSGIASTPPGSLRINRIDKVLKQRYITYQSQIVAINLFYDYAGNHIFDAINVIANFRPEIASQ